MVQIFAHTPCLEHMSKELNVMLDHGEAQPAVSCTSDNGSVSYLELVIAPIYETMVKEIDLFPCLTLLV
ncbi:hypothetical protein MKW92_046628 [Papaver armeniacum]|nr:hypothetical protein MKW92_046628 [Papaver armeniacum]